MGAQLEMFIPKPVMVVLTLAKGIAVKGAVLQMGTRLEMLTAQASPQVSDGTPRIEMPRNGA